MDFKQRKIEVSGLPELDSFEKGKIESALIASFDRIQKVVNNELFLNSHFKQHETGGKRTKNSVHLKLSFPGKTVVSSESGWSLVNVLQASLKTLEREAITSVKKA